MESIKIAGLTLKSESKAAEKEYDESQESTKPELTQMESNLERATTIQEYILSIIKRVEELPKSDTNIKALAKLKGALELLNYITLEWH